MNPLSLSPFWQDRADLVALIARLGGGEETRLVGGAVRDALIGKKPSDIDLATLHRPEAVISRLNAAGIRCVPTGLKHGTVTAVLDSGPVEITTLRQDADHDGRHARVTYTDDWRADAARRDFTINALYAQPDTGILFDYFEGAHDLARGCVRFIGQAEDRIAEDHLRILRFFRFFARFGAAPVDGQSYAACVARANDLMALSRERIAGEVRKLLAANDPCPAVQLMFEGALFLPIMPELSSPGLGRLHALIDRERAARIAPDGLRRFAALIGPDPALARTLASRLKLANAAARRLEIACGWPEPMPPATLAYRFGRESAVDRLLLGDGDPGRIAALDHWEKPVLPIGGGALIERGVVRGPAVAATLARVEQAWLDAGCPQGAAFEKLLATVLAATPGETAHGRARQAGLTPRLPVTRGHSRIRESADDKEIASNQKE